MNESVNALDIGMGLKWIMYGRVWVKAKKCMKMHEGLGRIGPSFSFVFISVMTMRVKVPKWSCLTMVVSF